MKKLLIIIAAIISLNTYAQKYITIPDAWVSTAANYDSLTNWVITGKLIGVPGLDVPKYQITDIWNPGNIVLNSIRTAGGDTENCPLYLVVTDTAFFYAKVAAEMGENTIAMKSVNNIELKSWGEYLRLSHEIYYNEAANRYYVLMADVNGKILGLNDVLKVRSKYTAYTGGYATLGTLAKIQKKQRDQETGVFK
jgi:hypothetical protein